jgi:Ser/Thr protein kinase RdoA (MazF antagonist)
MEAAGAFLARYHRAARQVPVRQPRPTETGFSRLRAVTPWDRLRPALETADALDRFTRLLEDLEAGLHELRYASLDHLVIHGDATNDNLIVDGTPPRIVGLIDFGSSHLAPWPADIAAALWRSARRIDSTVEADPTRVTDFVRGYHREAPIPHDLARAIPLLIQGRGLQLISRRVRRLRSKPEPSTLTQVALTLGRAAWVHEHRELLSDSIECCLRAGSERTTANLGDDWATSGARRGD